MRQVDQTPQMTTSLHRACLQLEVELACRFPQRIESSFQLSSTGTAALLQCLQLVLGLTDQLTAAVAALVRGDLLSLIEETQLLSIGPKDHRLADHLRRR